jgi:DNA-binding NarL/FixJ family response regulator
MKANMSSETRIVIADDHPILRRGLVQVIGSDPDLKIVAECCDGEEALARIIDLKPNIAVLDVNMPRLTGLNVAREVVRRKLRVEVVFLTIHSEEDLFRAAMETGAKGYLLKESVSEDILKALKTVALGQHYVTPSLSGHLVRFSRQPQALGEPKPGLMELTPTERRILSLIGMNKSSKEIAAELFIHYRTVENHRTNICQKLGLHGYHALFKFALEHKSEL